jgi:hypothetical protein
VRAAALWVWVEAGPGGSGAPIEVVLFLASSLFFRVFIEQHHTFSSKNSRNLAPKLLSRVEKITSVIGKIVQNKP